MKKCANCLLQIEDSVGSCPQCNSTKFLSLTESPGAPTPIPRMSLAEKKETQDRKISGWLWLPLGMLYIQYPVALWELVSSIQRVVSGHAMIYWPAILIDIIIMTAVTCLVWGFHKRKAIVPQCYAAYLLLVAGLWLAAQFFAPVGRFIPNGYLYLGPDPTIRPLIVGFLWSMVMIPLFATSRRVSETFSEEIADFEKGYRILRYLCSPFTWLAGRLLRAKAWAWLFTPLTLVGMTIVGLLTGTLAQKGYDDLTAWRASPSQSPSLASTKAVPVNFEPVGVDSDALRKALEKGVSVEGNVSRKEHTEYIGTSSSTYLISNLDLTITNKMRYGFEFGQDMMLVETDVGGSTFDGVYHARGIPNTRGDSPSFSGNGNDSYRLSSAEIHHVDGKITRLLGGGSTVTVKFGDKVSDKDREQLTFHALAPKQKTRITAAFEQGSWINDTGLASLRVALPEIQVSTKTGIQRFRVITYFTKPSDKDKPWTPSRIEIIPLQADQLTALVETPENNLVSRVFAANWLVKLDPEHAPSVLQRVVGAQHQGELLVTSLILMNELRARGFEEHALALVRDTKVPTGIRRLAMTYLGKVGCVESLPSIAELAGSTQEEDPLADHAIEVLGDFEGAKGLETLLALARSPSQTVRANTIARSLAKTKAPAAIETLMKQGREGQVPALDALAEAQLPECFDYFAELAAHPIEGVPENTVLHGLAASDRKKAVPILFAMLKQRSTATDQDPVEVSPLVQELIQLGADLPIDDLASLAHEGNQRALYILSNLDQEKAYPTLRKIAGSKAPVEARRTALRGLQRHWAKQSAVLFTSALNDDDSETVSIAIQGLQAAGDTTQIPTLLHLLKNEHASEVAQALEVLGPGTDSGEYFKALLASDDVSVLSSLVSGLIEHNWTDRQAIKPLLSRLDSLEPTAQFQIIRLLRHVTQNAVGPDDYSDFEKEPAAWVTRWKEWAKKQGLGEIASNTPMVPSIPKIPDIPPVPPVPELPQTILQAPAVSEQAPIDRPVAAHSEPKANTTEISQLKKPVFENTTKEPILLRYKLKQDQVMKLAMDANSEIQIDAGGQKMNMIQDIHFDAKARVTEVDEKGNISVLVKIIRLKMKMDGMAKVEFDSDKPDETNPAFQAVTAMIGVGIPCKISPIGEMLETDLEPLRLAVRRVNNAALTKTLEDSISKMFEGTFIQLSKDPIALGQTYKAGTVVSGGMKVQASYKIDSVKSDKSSVIMSPIMVIDMAKDAMPDAEAKVISQDASGWLLFDVEKGYSSEGQVHINMTLEISANGQKALMHTTTRVQSVSSLN